MFSNRWFRGAQRTLSGAARS